jgi:PPK2 family polyphosphate:nucleotide phosphotransferase
MDQYLIPPNTQVDLSQFDSYYTGEVSKKKGRAQLQKCRKDLMDLQELMYAENKRQILIVLQGIDTSGKDGTIRNVFGDVNPQGTHVISFKVPTRHELARDYLWRVHQHTPAKGDIVIFNRSHYEDVLVVRVHNLVPESVWEKRYQHINEFERLLVDEGAVILKFFLHISKQRQAERLLARLDRPISAGSSTRQTWMNGNIGKIISTRLRICSVRPVHPGRPGMWCPATENGIGTWWLVR